MSIVLDGTTGLAGAATGALNGALGGTTPSTVDATTVVASSTIKGATTIAVGNATPSASGAGITFPATQSASTDANTLDDYEEGTWTVTMTAATSGTITLSDNTGRYTKIGNRVFFNFRVDVSSVSSPVGELRVSLPFTVANLSPVVSCRSTASLFVYDSVATNIASFCGFIVQNTNYITVVIGNSSTGSAAAGQMKAGTQFHASGHFIVE